MSRRDVEWVRRALEHFGRTGEPYLEEVDPAVEVYDHDIPDARNPYRGFDGIATWLTDFGESWEHHELDVESTWRSTPPGCCTDCLCFLAEQKWWACAYLGSQQA